MKVALKNAPVLSSRRALKYVFLGTFPGATQMLSPGVSFGSVMPWGNPVGASLDSVVGSGFPSEKSGRDHATVPSLSRSTANKSAPRPNPAVMAVTESLKVSVALTPDGASSINVAAGLLPLAR